MTARHDIGAGAAALARRPVQLLTEAPWRVVLVPWAVARLVVLGSYLLAKALSSSAPRIAEQLHLSPLATPDQQLSQGLLAWDGSFYRDIAGHGYAYAGEESLRFFPGYSLLGRALSAVGLGSPSITLLIISNVAALLLSVVAYKLVMLELGDEAKARRGVWALNLFPASFVLVWGYSESLYLLLAITAFYAARRRRFGAAGWLGALAALTRPVGVVLSAAFAVEGLRSWRTASRGTRLTAVAAVSLPVVGAVAYLAWVGHAYGDPFLPFSIQDELRESSTPFGAVATAVSGALDGTRYGGLLHLPFVALALLLLFVTARRWPASYWVYSAGVLLIALSAENLNSIERYTLSAFPLLLAGAALMDTRTKQWVSAGLCTAGFAAFTTLSWIGLFVP